MPVERKKKEKVVSGGESSRHVECSGATPDFGVFFIGQFTPDLPIVHEVVVRKEAMRPVEDEGTEDNDESEILSVGELLSVVGGCESEYATFKEAVGTAGLVSDTETALDIAGLPIS